MSEINWISIYLCLASIAYLYIHHLSAVEFLYEFLEQVLTRIVHFFVDLEKLKPVFKFSIQDALSALRLRRSRDA